MPFHPFLELPNFGIRVSNFEGRIDVRRAGGAKDVHGFISHTISNSFRPDSGPRWRPTGCKLGIAGRRQYRHDFVDVA